MNRTFLDVSEVYWDFVEMIVALEHADLIDTPHYRWLCKHLADPNVRFVLSEDALAPWDEVESALEDGRMPHGIEWDATHRRYVLDSTAEALFTSIGAIVEALLAADGCNMLTTLEPRAVTIFNCLSKMDDTVQLQHDASDLASKMQNVTVNHGD